MFNKTSSLFFCVFISLSLFISPALHASPSISGGVWFNYRYHIDDDEQTDRRDGETMGDVADEAFVLYFEDESEDSPWSFTGEARFGPGAFTDPANNSTGDNVVLREAILHYQMNDDQHLEIGKSQVPFGWKTVNFWPGDMFLGGYGDQMDVGIKYIDTRHELSYQLAYYHADDWGETSTDTADDNGHWGSSETYRKVQTAVIDVNMDLNEQSTIGFSGQIGRLQDLTGNSSKDEIDGDHHAFSAYYTAEMEEISLKAQLLRTRRELPRNYYTDEGINERVETTVLAGQLGYTVDKWFWYADATAAKSHSKGNNTGNIFALSTGFHYNYGPGWFYAELLTQDGFIDQNGDTGEYDFSALYLSIDYYF